MMRKSRFFVVVFIAVVLAVVVLPQNGIASSFHQEAVSYVVRRGDNLSSIASRYGTSVSAIVQANGLATTVIWPGQTLLIPAASGQTTTPGSNRNTGVSAGGGSHVVRSGESLWSIASRYGVSVNALKSQNGLTSDVILPGQTLSIPAANGAPGSAITSGASSGSSARVAGCAGGYVVRPGDTLSSIAVRCGVSVPQLRLANGITGSAIYRGQLLSIPASPPAASPPTGGTAAPSQPASPPPGQPSVDLPVPTPVPPFPPLSYPPPGQ